MVKNNIIEHSETLSNAWYTAEGLSAAQNSNLMVSSSSSYPDEAAIDLVEDMLAMQRVGSPAVSPVGRWIAFAVRDTDLAANRGRFVVWLASTDGATVRRLTTDAENDTDPAWSPDGRWVYFLSTRGGSSQVWRIAPGGGEAEAVTKLPVDLNGFQLFPDGKRLVIAADVWPAARSIAESVKRDEEKAKSKVKARAYDQLLFRHWGSWEGGRCCADGCPATTRRH